MRFSPSLIPLWLLQNDFQPTRNLAYFDPLISFIKFLVNQAVIDFQFVGFIIYYRTFLPSMDAEVVTELIFSGIGTTKTGNELNRALLMLFYNFFV